MPNSRDFDRASKEEEMPIKEAGEAGVDLNKGSFFFHQGLARTLPNLTKKGAMVVRKREVLLRGSGTGLMMSFQKNKGSLRASRRVGGWIVSIDRWE